MSMPTMIEWILKPFDALSVRELYAVLRLRNEVFVVEQNCVFQDADNMDPECLHFMGWREGSLVAYTRIAAPGIIYDEASIGRVVTAPAARGNGLGRLLMNESIARIHALYGSVPIRIGAQVHLTGFYTQLGFQLAGESYIEDGIPHIHMLRVQ